MDNTKIFDSDIMDEIKIKSIILEVIEILESRGYDPIDQLVGYLISGDPGYITSYKEARSKIINLDRNSILEVMLKSYVKR